MTSFRVATIACLALALCAGPVAAQSAGSALPSELRDGRRALSFGVLSGGGGTVGYSLMLSSRTALTIDVHANGQLFHAESATNGVITNERDQLRFDVLLAPGFRRYMAGRGDVASYIAGRLLLGVGATIAESDGSATTTEVRNESWAPMAGAALGFGLEWFVTDAMSLRTEAVVDGTFRYETRTEDPANSEDTVWSLDAGLGRSALALTIWF